MAFSSAARQVEVPRGDSGEDDDAKEYMKVEDDDAARSPAQRDDDIIDEDEYMMFDGGNETSMIWEQEHGEVTPLTPSLAYFWYVLLTLSSQGVVYTSMYTLSRNACIYSALPCYFQ